ncbi:MAG TPA: PaaI family thioesterase [Polyangiaceae bacterium]|nr:PaaI family thioesterase [Polyangiaceae bacterium]
MSGSVTRKKNYWSLAETPSKAVLAKRRLATAVRELVRLTATTDAPEAALDDVAGAVEAVLGRLRTHPTRTFRDAFATCKTEEDFAPFADRSLMTGRSHPFSPPIQLSMQGDKVVGNVTFATTYEGVPGHAHGGMVAAVLDETLGYLAVNHDIGGLTAMLTIRYRAPTPLGTELSIEANVVRTDGKKAFVEGRIRAGDMVTAEAEAVFVAVDRERMLAVIDSAKKDTDKG